MYCNVIEILTQFVVTNGHLLKFWSSIRGDQQHFVRRDELRVSSELHNFKIKETIMNT